MPKKKVTFKKGDGKRVEAKFAKLSHEDKRAFANEYDLNSCFFTKEELARARKDRPNCNSA